MDKRLTWLLFFSSFSASKRKQRMPCSHQGAASFQEPHWPPLRLSILQLPHNVLTVQVLFIVVLLAFLLYCLHIPCGYIYPSSQLLTPH